MRNERSAPTSRPRPRRSFTLVELIVAGVITAFVLGTVAASLGNLARSRHSSRQRLEAFLRADTALETIRRDVASIVRHDDLFFMRFLLVDGVRDTEIGRVNRDDMLMFSHRLRQARTIEFNGEGTEYEVQYRVEEHDAAPMLWNRRDSFPDKYPRGGGIATPVVESVVALNVEAYDGFQWRTEWDSDFDGMPHALRITVTASGDAGDADVYEAPLATLRTVVSLDRILPLRENLVALYEAEHGADEEDADAPTAIDGQLPGLDGAGGLPPGVRVGPDGTITFTPGGDLDVVDPSTIVLPRGRQVGPNASRDDVRMPNRTGGGTSTSSSGGRGGGNQP